MASSTEWEKRRPAVPLLVGLLSQQPAEEALLALPLDNEDTAVTEETAGANTFSGDPKWRRSWRPHCGQSHFSRVRRMIRQWSAAHLNLTHSLPASELGRRDVVEERQRERRAARRCPCRPLH